MMKLVSKLLLALALVCTVTARLQAAEDDPVKLSPKSYHVRLDNHEARVLDVWLKPGAKTPMHNHPDSIIYVVQGGVLRFTDDKGKSVTTRLRAGQVIWRNDEDHMVQNVGRHSVHVIQTELKGVRFF